MRLRAHALLFYFVIIIFEWKELHIVTLKTNPYNELPKLAPTNKTCAAAVHLVAKQLK